MRDTIKKMRGDKLTISDPNSIIKTARSVKAETSNSNGHRKYTKEQLARIKQLESEKPP